MLHQSIHHAIETGKFIQARELIQNIPDDHVVILENEILEKEGQYQEVMQNLQARSIQSSTSEYVKFGRMYQTSAVYFRMGEFEDGTDHVQRMFDEYEENDYNIDKIGYWLICGYNLLASLHSMQYQFDEGRELYTKGIKLSDKLGYGAKLGSLYNNLAAMESFAGNYDKAIAYDNLAMDIYEKQGFDRFIAVSKGNMAEIYIVKGDFDQAKLLLHEAISVLEQMDTYDALTDNLIKLAIINYNEKLIQKALKLLQRANYVAQKNQNPFYLSYIYFYMILFNLELGEFFTSNKILEKFEALNSTSENPINRSRYMLSKGAYYYYTGKLDKAILWYEKSNQIDDYGIMLQTIYHKTLAYIQMIKRGAHSLDEIKLITDEIMTIKNLAKNLRSPFLQIKFHILQSQVYLLELNPVRTFKELDKATTLATKHNIEKLLEDINKIKRDLKANSINWKPGSDAFTLEERINNSLLEYYIKQMISLDISN